MRRVVIAAADASRDAAAQRGTRTQAILVTLTYREGAFWSTRHVSEYRNRVAAWLRRRGIAPRFQWVIELTARGRPHYHVLWWVPHGVRLPKPDASGHWTHGLSRIELARRPVGYLVKYATKGTDGKLPSGARLFGTGAPEADVKLATHRAGLPMWLSESTEPDSRWSRRARVGWVEKESGEVRCSPFVMQVTRDEWGFVVIIVTRIEQC